ncbi:hypothetical protein LTR78_003824 [Recurvomyces mirabilis]|uniref:Heterokaryon incompatibility domain-containing protein n=1 Tax=Recurvomyces mirabilis TaxID=574656 RepID=A0AAE0WR95_9PEZI|nr:hypothetical protein LTR78_003824 [Recurvomyces mirabilis]KAK5154936.1 hypothetical protein LTS14_006517 [Recurvomyces mirabilis]
MWLIHVDTRKLHWHAGETLPRYAILSHTWGDNEVTFQDMHHQIDRSIHDKAGYRKIDFTCNRAKADGLYWAWVDTCCIDKSSSAELSEAINSMFRWYHNARTSSTTQQQTDQLSEDTTPSAIAGGSLVDGHCKN